jgi:hypothetical protein
MRLGDYITENQQLFKCLLNSGVVSFTVIEQSKVYNEVKYEMLTNKCEITVAVEYVAEQRKVNKSTIWRALNKMKKDVSSSCTDTGR